MIYATYLVRMVTGFNSIAAQKYISQIEYYRDRYSTNPLQFKNL